MILESRSIIFSDEELVIALAPLLEAKQLPTDIAPDRVETGLDGSGEVSIKVQTDSDPMVFNSREVGAAILNHCIDVGIPLPRGSYKELAIRGDHIALIVRLETGSMMSEIEEDEE